MAEMQEEKKEYIPGSNFVNSLLTDLYQITMTYAYWKNKHEEQTAVFDLFFRKCPFKGEYTIFGGLDECLRFLNTFGFSQKHLQQLEGRFPTWDKKFWEYLGTLDAALLTVYAQREGSVCFPRIPLLRIEGPVAVCQLIETTLLNLVNYASLVTTNACRIRQCVGTSKALLEFGLRRAQGPDGAMSASKYAYIGGFDGTSNVLAGIINDIPIKGTHAHSFVSSFTGIDALNKELINIPPINGANEKNTTFIDTVLEYRSQLEHGSTTNLGELAAFIAYAFAFPTGFLALVDTYDTLNSGVPNFIAVSLALHDLGYKPIGIRLDSGDLAFLSKESRAYFKKIAAQFKIASFEKFNIVASNDINESVLHALNEQGHEIDSFGIGTHLVTCKRQPALGCVYKLVAINGQPRIKVSQSQSKMTVPGKKMAYRLWTASRNEPILDVLVRDPEEVQPDNLYCKTDKQCLCEHPFDGTKRCRVTPSKVEQILIPVFEKGKVVYDSPSLQEIRTHCQTQIARFRRDYLRFTNPTPYKVSVSGELRDLTQRMWRSEVPVVDYQ
eukprot:CAMPEP_0202697660 /NCGR_PEP_ID=MMETSP1385-20130828/10957_1 /ASSEMBLY_ACC=CAM_ASM_000861 /TAXON_ID=933848 /ORGANISM="Elphidium margaritaceum" /LENGTH=553 /DNA_ID=CAMNT_0049354173 /DNA_START=68 /DNA_END=1729 /DNA_ORIENTATION=+